MTWTEDNLAAMLHGLVLAGSDEDLAPYLSTTVALSASATFDQVLTLVAFAHRLEGKSADGGESVAVAASEYGLEVEAGSELARRLAAIALAQSCTNAIRAPSVLAALAIRSCRFGNLDPALPVLSELADLALDRFADEARQQRLTTVDLRRSFVSNAGALPGSSPATQVTEKVLHETVSGLRKGTREALGVASGALNSATLTLARISEEVDLLWWSQHPTVPGRDSMPDEPTPLVGVIAAEVGRRLLVDPPPRGLRSLISSVYAAAGADPDEKVNAGEMEEAPRALAPALQARIPAHPWATPGLNALAREDQDDTSAPAIDWTLQVVLEQALLRVYAT